MHYLDLLEAQIASGKHLAILELSFKDLDVMHWRLSKAEGCNILGFLCWTCLLILQVGWCGKMHSSKWFTLHWIGGICLAIILGYVCCIICYCNAFIKCIAYAHFLCMLYVFLCVCVCFWVAIQQAVAHNVTTTFLCSSGWPPRMHFLRAQSSMHPLVGALLSHVCIFGHLTRNMCKIPKLHKLAVCQQSKQLVLPP